MMRKFLATIVMAVMVMIAGAFGGLAYGQTTGATLDNTSLQTMLQQMGYEIRPLSKGYLITLKGDNNWTFYMQAVLSGDNSKLGLNANLGMVENPDAVPGGKWEGLLIANGDVDPSTFYFDKDQKKLYLHRALDNRDVTPQFLRAQIESFGSNIVDTASLWDFTK